MAYTGIGRYVSGTDAEYFIYVLGIAELGSGSGAQYVVYRIGSSSESGPLHILPEKDFNRETEGEGGKLIQRFKKM